MVVVVVAVAAMPPQPLPPSTLVPSGSHTADTSCQFDTVRSPVAGSTAQYRSEKTQAVHARCPQLHDHL